MNDNYSLHERAFEAFLDEYLALNPGATEADAERAFEAVAWKYTREMYSHETDAKWQAEQEKML